MCCHKQLDHDDHQQYHSLNASYAVVKISGLAQCWFWSEFSQEVFWVSKCPFDILIDTLTSDMIYRSNLKYRFSAHFAYWNAALSFTQSLIQTQIKESIKAPRHWALCVEFTGTGEFPAQMASNAENVSIRWRYHEYLGEEITPPNSSSDVPVNRCITICMMLTNGICGRIAKNTNTEYRQIFNTRRTTSQTLNVSCLVLQLSLPNPLKPGVKSSMKM